MSFKDTITKAIITQVENGKVPDFLIRIGVRNLLKKRLQELKGIYQDHSAFKKYTDDLRKRPLAEFTEVSKEQHYEVPPEFFVSSLGPHLKYSCSHWEPGVHDLGKAEESALKITVERARLADHQNILELGCGWGSLSLYMAKHFPKATITVLSHSTPQRLYIEEQARQRNLTNLKVITRNILEAEKLHEEFGSFDRIVSVEMFEHLKNYQLMFSRLAEWLKPDGLVFVHVFAHKKFPYHFEVAGEDDWMSRYFFTGGQMPSIGLFSEFKDHLQIQDQWEWNGQHYQKTSRAWLGRMDQKKPEIIECFRKTYGANHLKWFQRWRLFYIACEELFGFDEGREWKVAHYLFARKNK